MAAETSEANAKVSETNAAAAQTTADGFAASAKLSSEAAAGFATTAQQAVAGITATVSAEVDKNLKVTFASIIAMRAVAGDTQAKLELVALSDPSGSRAAGIMTGDFQSFDFVKEVRNNDGTVKTAHKGWRLGRDGKAELSAADIRGPLTADLANVRGTLSAAHIDADVRNWTPISPQQSLVFEVSQSAVIKTPILRIPFDRDVYKVLAYYEINDVVRNVNIRYLNPQTIRDLTFDDSVVRTSATNIGYVIAGNAAVTSSIDKIFDNLTNKPHVLYDAQKKELIVWIRDHFIQRSNSGTSSRTMVVPYIFGIRFPENEE